MIKVLSISVAAYNIEKYIHQMMNSLIDANCMDDIEILIVDDGSKDNTASIASEYEKKYPESVKLISKENGGHGSTINKGITEATGKYFRALDGDDWVNSDNLNQLITELKKIDVDLVVCDYDKCYEDGRIETQCFDNISPMKILDFVDTIHQIPWMCYHTIIYRTEILQKNNIRLDEHCFYVDAEYDLFPIPYIKSIFYFNMPVYCYRLGIDGQSVSPESRKKNIKHGQIVACKLLELCEGLPNDISDAQRDYIVSGTADHCIWHIQSLLLFKGSNQKEKEIKQFDEMIKTTSQPVYKKMEDLGKESRVIKLLRKCYNASYWTIKMYKAIKN